MSQVNIEERYLNVHEAAELLDITEEELWDIVHQHKVPTHNIAGAFLRFRKEDIEHLKIKWRIERALFPKMSKYFPHDSTVSRATFVDRFRDFWYFNDYYVVCVGVVLVLLYLIISSQ